MKAALRGSYMEFAVFKGVTERYPFWFAEELYRCTYQDESRFTIWIPEAERSVDYHEKTLFHDYSVFLRKPTGELFVLDMDLFTDNYTVFNYTAVTNSGLVAFNDDCIEYVECRGGRLIDEYPYWFYEYFTEALNFPHVETMFFYDAEKHRVASNKGPFIEFSVRGEVNVTDHTVFLRNKFGEIKGMLYSDFIKHYDPEPKYEQEDSHEF